jgi:hypothetical protein
MSTTKFLFLYRTHVDAKKPSPEEAQALYAQWKGWMDKFEKEILDTGEGINPAGGVAVVKGGSVTDGPYVESKELMGGYSFIQTTSLERAVEIARECPFATQPGGSVEIRELRSYARPR